MTYPRHLIVDCLKRYFNRNELRRLVADCDEEQAVLHSVPEGGSMDEFVEHLVDELARRDLLADLLKLAAGERKGQAAETLRTLSLRFTVEDDRGERVQGTPLSQQYPQQTVDHSFAVEEMGRVLREAAHDRERRINALLKRYPRCGQLWFRWARHLYGEGHDQKALCVASKGLRMVSGLGDRCNLLMLIGSVHLEQFQEGLGGVRELRRALRAFGEARELAPGDPLVHSNLLETRMAEVRRLGVSDDIAYNQLRELNGVLARSGDLRAAYVPTMLTVLGERLHQTFVPLPEWWRREWSAFCLTADEVASSAGCPYVTRTRRPRGSGGVSGLGGAILLLLTVIQGVLPHGGALPDPGAIPPDLEPVAVHWRELDRVLDVSAPSDGGLAAIPPDIVDAARRSTSKEADSGRPASHQMAGNGRRLA